MIRELPPVAMVTKCQIFIILGSRVLEKRTVVLLLTEFRAIYGTRGSITVSHAPATSSAWRQMNTSAVHTLILMYLASILIVSYRLRLCPI